MYEGWTVWVYDRYVISRTTIINYIAIHCYHRGHHYHHCHHNPIVITSIIVINIKIYLFTSSDVCYTSASWQLVEKSKFTDLQLFSGLLSNTADHTISKETDSTQEDNCSVSCGIGVLKETKPCKTSTLPSNTTTTITNTDKAATPGTFRDAKCSQGQKNYEEKTECIQPSCPECFVPMRVTNTSNARYRKTQYVTSLNQSHSDSIGQQRNGMSMTNMWCSDLLGKDQFSEIDLGKPVKVTGKANFLFFLQCDFCAISLQFVFVNACDEHKITSARTVQIKSFPVKSSR